MVKVRYVGGRGWIKIFLNRKSYIFSKENNRTLDIKDQNVLNHIFSLNNRAEFQVVLDEPKVVDEPKVEVKEEIKIVPKKSGRPKKGNK
jgi:hypothetical protein